MKWIAIALLALLPGLARAQCGESFYPWYLDFPSTGGSMIPSAAIWILDSPQWALMDIQVEDASGAIVPALTQQLGQFRVIRPIAGDWAVGTYTVGTEYGAAFEIEVVPGTHRTPSLPVVTAVEAWGGLTHEVIPLDEYCYPIYPGTIEPWAGVRVQMCSEDPFTLAVLSDEEPPWPEPDDGLPWELWEPRARRSFDTVDGWLDAAPGSTGIVWIGSIQRTLEFSGWVGVEVVLPDGENQVQVVEGYTLDSLPSTWAECPDEGLVVLEGEQQPPEDDPPPGRAPEDAGGCGCSTTAPSAPWWMWLPLVIRIRRRG